jgi:hypothetical protein
MVAGQQQAPVCFFGVWREGQYKVKDLTSQILAERAATLIWLAEALVVEIITYDNADRHRWER